MNRAAAVFAMMTMPLFAPKVAAAHGRLKRSATSELITGLVILIITGALTGISV